MVWPPSWIFLFRFFPLCLYSVDTCSIGMPDPENIGIAVGIALLSSLGAEIRGGSVGPPWPFTEVFPKIISSTINLNCNNFFLLKVCISTYFTRSDFSDFTLTFNRFHLHSNGVGGPLDPRRPDKGNSDWEFFYKHLKPPTDDNQ